ncbi:MAG: IS200/IS605 family accessory protein TnpB-related protein [Methanotrichaceae archaeon]
MSGRVARFSRDVNHCISKKIVKRHQQAIVLENLRGIRNRVTVRKVQRGKLHSWGFYQLRQFIEKQAEDPILDFVERGFLLSEERPLPLGRGMNALYHRRWCRSTTLSEL